MKYAYRPGFTLVELLIVMFVIGILAALIIPHVAGADDHAKEARVRSEIDVFRNSVVLYVQQHDYYPEDVNRDDPAQINAFLEDTEMDDWPTPAWANKDNSNANGSAVVSYDFDAWDVYSGDTNSVQADIDGDGDLETVQTPDTIQISVRFCTLSNPLVCNFPDEPWITDSWDRTSAYYYCIKGYCRSHPSESYDHPGYCINCSGDKSVGIPYPGED